LVAVAKIALDGHRDGVSWYPHEVHPAAQNPVDDAHERR